MDLQEMLGVTVSSLEKFISTKTCVGEPIVIGDVTLIPVQTVSFGYGSGGGEGKQTDQSGTGGGSGAGASLKPIAVIAVKGADVQVFPLGGKGVIEKIAAMLPDALSKIKIGKGKKEAEEPKDE
jgi:uncharacterized spore protein YtfJ